ncbi:MAG: hypothetical protein Q8L48_40100 [Archangium sp.]|nr:hypothetical protein [Archangium sp.]
MTPCPSCGAERGHLLGCEHDTIALAPVDLTEPGLELDTTRARAWGVPIALGVAGLLAFSGPGGFVLRIFFGMWLHEAGHAIASWCCGVVAVPLPWLTLGGGSRSPVFIVLLFAGLAALGYRWRRLAPVFAGLAGVLLVGILVPFRHATTFIVFSGDGGALVLGTLLMLGTVLLPDGARLSRGALRWGYLVIGAGAFMDAFVTWVKAWRDWAELPFGRSESSGLSDASRLVDLSGWTEVGLVRSYLVLGFACLALLTAVTAWRLTSAARPARAR